MLFAAYTLVLISTYALALRPPEPPSRPAKIHFTISRRGGPFPTSDVANLTYLSEQLAAAEARFDLTRREIRGNKVVRVAKPRGGGGLRENGVLLGEVGRDGNWFAKLDMGDPPQGIELDLDTLTSDFFVQSTTSHQGSEYIDVASSSYQGSNQHPFSGCLYPSEKILVPTINESRSISFAHCRPSKSSIDTLRKCGSMLGLAPSYSLSQTKTPSLIKQLADAGVVDRNLFSTMFLNGHEGVLSVGGTAASEVRRASELVQERLDRFSEWEKTKKQSAGFEAPPEEESVVMKRSVTDHIQHNRDPSDWRSEWRFTPTQGAVGWWQILMPGVWINNIKTLKNQPTVIDLSTPFVLAPPSGARAFYAAIPGSVRLPPPHSRFHAFPCLNKPTVHFEFAGWNFPVFSGPRDDAASDGGLGGRLSLGRVAKGSGHCVGAVVETLMGVGHAAGYVRAGSGGGRAGPEAGVLAGNGMRGALYAGRKSIANGRQDRNVNTNGDKSEAHNESQSKGAESRSETLDNDCTPNARGHPTIRKTHARKRFAVRGTASGPIIAELVRARVRAQATPTSLLADLSGTLGSGALGGGAGGGNSAATVTGRLMRTGNRVLVRCLAEDRASRLEGEREARPDVGVDVGFEVERVERSKGVGEGEKWTRMLAGRRSGWVGCGVGGDGVGVGEAERSGAWEGGGGVTVAVAVEDADEEETDGLTFRGRDGGSDE
ncbi:hypothetical protein B0A49_10347 [Cryomyces minteri]|uniref:Peptidase A1 domain-containing protein n=1 Tax=Cryomyces minteri TaxID=331657 RepID=A0A4U0WWV5_9PEZI|nr:hypothetical protein B0A49_10347 [Cryomyces minteri]